MHGILRGNARPPYTRSPLFGNTDPRLAFIVQQPDARIHFALNCGAYSYPPVQVLSRQHLYEELSILAASFCALDENVRVNSDKGQLHVSQLFGWYRPDFCDSNNKLPVAVASYAHGTKREELEQVLRSNRSLKVVFEPFDWSPNTIEHDHFTAEKLSVSTKRVRHLLRNGSSSNNQAVAV